MTRCNTFWGSHGCALPAGHDGHHECAECSLYDELSGRIEYLREDGWHGWCRNLDDE